MGAPWAFLNFLAGGGGRTGLERHDAKYHGGRYDGRGSCRYREEMARGDGADRLDAPGARPFVGGGPWAARPRRAVRPKYEAGARMALVSPDGVAPGRAVALSSADFSEVLGEASERDRILAVSDLHDAGFGGLGFGGFGTVLVAGDFTRNGATSESRRKGMDAAVRGGVRWLEEEFFPMARRNAGRRFVLVAGNHDHFLASAEARAIEWPGNVDYLCDSEAVVSGMRVYGSPWCARRSAAAMADVAAGVRPPQFSQKPFEVGEEELRERYSLIPEGLDVLLVHQPPKCAGYDGDLTEHGHCGSEALADAIRRARPKLVVCGHLHAGDHRPFRIGDSVVVNAARTLGRSEEAFHPREIVRVDGAAERGGAGFALDGESDGLLPEPEMPEDFDDEEGEVGGFRAGAGAPGGGGFDFDGFRAWLESRK